MDSENTNEATIFNAARKILDKQERDAYLAASCEGNPPLRDRIEALLAAAEAES